MPNKKTKKHRTQQECIEFMESISMDTQLEPKDIMYDYSGRGMYGAECIAYCFESIEEAEEFKEAIHDRNENGAIDNLAFDWVVYSTSMTFTDNDDPLRGWQSEQDSE